MITIIKVDIKILVDFIRFIESKSSFFEVLYYIVLRN